MTTHSQLTREELFNLAGDFLTERGCATGDRIPVARVQAYLCLFWNEIDAKLGRDNSLGQDSPEAGGPHP